MTKPQHAISEVSDLPRWAKLALARMVIYGETAKDAAEMYNKSHSSLSKYASSPAGKQWRESIVKLTDDPDEIARALLRASTLGVAFDALWALETAREAGDYKEVGVISRDFMNRRQDVFPKLAESMPAPTIVINLHAGDLEAPIVASSHVRAIEAPSVDADFEVVD